MLLLLCYRLGHSQDIPEAFKKMTSLRQLLRWTTWIKFTDTRRRPLTPVISNLYPFQLNVGRWGGGGEFDGIIIRPCWESFSCFDSTHFLNLCLLVDRARIVCIPPPPSLSEWEEDQQLQLEQHKSQGDAEKKELQQQQQSDGGGGGGEATSPSRLTIAEIPPVSEVDARNALLGLVTEHCCWGRSAARHMSIGKILSSSAFHVKMTF
jgi:hypothetical protein